MEFAYNKNAHVSIGMNLVQVMYGQDCLTPASWTISITQVETFDQMLNMMQLKQENIKDCMLKPKQGPRPMLIKQGPLRNLNLGIWYSSK
jgi:hypothetical protein